MSEQQVLLATAAFLDSRHALAIQGAPTAAIREITKRFLTCCYADMAKAPRLLAGDEMEAILRDWLPRRFGVQDPLAPAVEEVLGCYLAFLQETEMVSAAYEIRQALTDHAETFRASVHSGAAHAEGVARLESPKAIRNRAEKTGRNDPCPCGSGKKFKKCCMGLGR